MDAVAGCTGLRDVASAHTEEAMQANICYMRRRRLVRQEARRGSARSQTRVSCPCRASTPRCIAGLIAPLLASDGDTLEWITPLGPGLLPVDAGPVAEPFLGDLEAVARSLSLLLLSVLCLAAATRVDERKGNGRVWRDG